MSDDYLLGDTLDSGWGVIAGLLLAIFVVTGV